MGDTHLHELRSALEKKGWHVLSENGGDGYRISAVWRIQRSTRVQPIEILFEGIDDLRCLPLEQAYACKVKGTTTASIYFGSMKMFKKALPDFVNALDRVELDYLKSV